MLFGGEVFEESEIVIELEIVKKGDKWYRKGLDMKGDECWEEMVDGEYSDDWIDEVIGKEKKDEWC